MVIQGFDPVVIPLASTSSAKDSICWGIYKSNKNNQKMSSHMDPSSHSMGAQTWLTKSSVQGKKSMKHKYSQDEGKFCELHHAMDHDIGKCKVLKAQAHKMQANWEMHRSKYKT